MILESERLILRPMVETDLEDFYDIFSTEEVGRFVNKMSHEAVERYFEIFIPDLDCKCCGND